METRKCASRGRRQKKKTSEKTKSQFHFDSSLNLSSSFSNTNSMLGSAPQLQDAPGVAYLCGDCGELKRRRRSCQGEEETSAILFFRRRRRLATYARLLVLLGARALLVYLHRSCLEARDNTLSLARAEEWSRAVVLPVKPRRRCNVFAVKSSRLARWPPLPFFLSSSSSSSSSLFFLTSTSSHQHRKKKPQKRRP